MHVGVIGAGIIGINTGLRIQSEFPNAQVTLIAQEFDKDTLSNGAAGIFRPGTNFEGPTPEITREWIYDSYNFYDDLLRSQDADKAGVFQVSGYIFSSKYKSVTRNHLLQNLLPVYRSATEAELKLCPGDWKYGSYFRTMIIESSDFLPWARQRFQAAGGKVINRQIESLKELQRHNFTSGQEFDVVFNCTGFGAKWLCNDSKLVPVRGQVMKVKAPWIKMFYYGDYDTYIIPGRNTVTLGGCRQMDSYNENVDPHDSQGIWERCTSLVPSLKKSTLVREWVGLRPFRTPVRCEIEEISTDHDKKLKVIHQYGHGGYGVTTAPGSAKYAVKLLHETLRSGNQAQSSKNETPAFYPSKFFRSQSKL